MKPVKFLMFDIAFSEKEEAVKYKVAFLDSVFLLAGVVAFGLGFVRMRNSTLLGAMDLAFSGINLALLYYLNRHKARVEAVASVALALCFALFCAIYLLAPHNPTRIALFFLLAASAFFLKGRRVGRIWLVVILAAVVAGHFLPGIDTGYSHFDLLTACLYLFALFFVFENYETQKEDQHRRDQEQEVLRRTEELTRLALEGAGDAVWYWNLETDELRYSRRFAEMLGLGEGELGHRHGKLLERLAPEEREPIARRLMPGMDDGQLSLEYRLQTRNRDWKWILRRGRVTRRDTQGRPLRMAGTHVDITARKEAEAALRASEERFRTIANYTYDWEYWEDPERRLLYVSPSCERITGYSADEFLADPELMDRIAHPDDKPLIESHRQHILTAALCETEFRIITKSGETRWIAHGCEAVQGDDGRPLGRRASNRDVTEKKQAELEYRTIVQTALDGFLVVGPDSRFIEANEAYCRMSGYSREELLALGPPDVDAMESPEEVARHTAEIRRDGHAQFESQHRRKDGSVVAVEITANLLDIRGGILFTFIRDITERKRVEAELERHRQGLEAAVAERTAELKVAVERAEAASRAKSAFLANMSHEIRTPLNAITGMAHLIRREGLSAKQFDRMDKLETAGRHLAEVINDILDISKIEAGRVELAEAELDVADMVHKTADMLRERIAAKGLTLVVEVSAPRCLLLGDDTRLRQALLNYLGNALKFTEEGAIVLRARTEGEDAGSARLRFEVEDTGIGIAPDVLPRLFTPFEQADNSFTRAYGGTGLGLVITRKIAQLMGGDAGASSTPGMGSTFWFTCRLRKAIPSAHTLTEQ